MTAHGPHVVIQNDGQHPLAQADKAVQDPAHSAQVTQPHRVATSLKADTQCRVSKRSGPT